MSEAVRYRLRVKTAASEFLGRDYSCWAGDINNDAPVKAILPEGMFLKSGYDILEVVGYYVSIAEAENQPRNDFSEEILERACDIVRPFRCWLYEDAWLGYQGTEETARQEDALVVIRQVVQKALADAIA